MTTNDYVPDVQVEIAFDSGWSTPAASRTWTDVSAYVELGDGIGIGFGRQDEFAVADANTLSLALDNKDGRFTPGNASSPYSPNVKLGRPVRVTVTPAGEAESSRFVGYVDAWPVAWDGVDSYAKVQLSASSRLARLGSASQLRSIVEEEFLRASPAALFPLSEPEGATTAYNLIGGEAATQAGSGAAVTFGTATGPGTDGLTAATFPGGRALLAQVEASGSGEHFWMAWWFNTTSADEQYAIVVYTPGSLGVVAGMLPGGAIFGEGPGPILNSPQTYNDGALHLAVVHLEQNGANVDGTLYVDDEAVDASSAAGTLDTEITNVIIGATGTSGINGQFWTGTLAYPGFGFTDVSGLVADWYAAGRDGLVGETPGDRLTRYASYGGVPAGEIDADTGTPPMAHVDTTGQTALDMMRRVEATEGGVLFDATDGTLTFHGRGRRYLATTDFTLAADEQQIGEDYAPEYDQAALVNTVTATLTDETVTAVAVDQDSVDDYGPRSDALELMTTDANEPHAAAWWRVGNYAEPAPRVASLTVDLLPLSDADKTLILGLTVGSLVTVTGLPSQAANDSEDYFVEGYGESIGYGVYELTFNVSPAAPYLTTWVLNSATRSQLGTTTRLAY